MVLSRASYNWLYGVSKKLRSLPLVINDAQGITSNWRKPFSDGSYPPPPLNGSAYAWHHPFSVLKNNIQYGEVALGGKMPAFKDKLTEKEIEAAIAYFQSKWNSEIYNQWVSRGGLDK